MWVALDTMSGDLGPAPAVKGAAMAVKEFGARIILVGDPAILKPLCGRLNLEDDNIRIEEASDVISMNDSPSQMVRFSKNASVVVAARLVKEGEAIGFFSPGNTGASMAAALLITGKIKGVKRPAIATPLPREDGGITLLLDSGANVDCRAEWLEQFAVMGITYATEIIEKESPTVALLSTGGESNSGNRLNRAAYERLDNMAINFIGNVEGHDIYGGHRCADIVVCDGFHGNIVLKVTEGFASSIFKMLRQNIASSQLHRAGAYLLKPALKNIKRRMDAAEYGGAPLLGVRGNCIIGHGTSNVKAFKNAIKVVQDFARKDLNRKIEENIGKLK